MAKVITTIASEDGMDIGAILSFKTNHYIGIWDYAEEKFMLVYESDKCFEPEYLCCLNGSGYFEDLRELYEVVYNKCGEHITEVFDKCNYTITLD